MRDKVRDEVRDGSPEMPLNKGFLTQKVRDEGYLPIGKIFPGQGKSNFSCHEVTARYL